MIKYSKPNNWIDYDPLKIVDDLVEAKSAIKSLQSMPYQKSWAENLQKVQMKREVAGTSRIEGAEFTDQELEDLMEDRATLESRSLRQAAAAKKCYQWISELEHDVPISKDLILNIHRLAIEGADDDRCPAGRLRAKDENVNFGAPRHRGVDGGKLCEEAFEEFCLCLQTNYEKHDPTIQALAAHYHLVAMHPFLDGNGRTARAIEALMLRRAKLRTTLFISMSNYYYEEKDKYLDTLAEVRAANFDLTSFLKFGLQGIAQQCNRLSRTIKKELDKALYVNMMNHLFKRKASDRKRALAKRQMAICHILLQKNRLLEDLYNELRISYSSLKSPWRAFIRDVNYLIHIDAISYERLENPDKLEMFARLDWPTEITDTLFFTRTKAMPKSLNDSYLPTSI